MTEELDRATLEAANCWFGSDHVAKRPDVTAFKRRARHHQATWREARGLPIGSHVAGRDRVTYANGSKIELAHARASGANFLSDRVRAAVDARLASKAKQPHQTLDEDRLWGDLLSSMPMCFNLFGELHDAPDRLSAATKALAPNHPGTASSVQFEWSPGRRDVNYLGDQTAFDAAVMLDCGDGTRGVIGIETKYHEHAVNEKYPTNERYWEITERSGLFPADWEDRIFNTPLQQIWRDHLLVLSMLEQPEWTWGLYLLVAPESNPSFVEAGPAYRELLVDPTTFEMRTIEDLLDSHTLHPPEVEVAFRERYLLWK